MSDIAGQTTGTNWLPFFEETIWVPPLVVIFGGNIGKQMFSKCLLMIL